MVDEKVASDMMNAMESVAEGYNKFVKVDGYRMAAKSGTAEVQGSMARSRPLSPIIPW